MADGIRLLCPDSSVGETDGPVAVPIKFRKVVSGGQTGVDVAALKAAKQCGVATGGFMPKGWLTEEGPRPEYAEQYGLMEHPQSGWIPRTESNVLGSRATVILTMGSAHMSGGTGKTWSFCRYWCRPYWIQDVESETGPLMLAQWLRGHEVVNFAGPRESKRPGIEEKAERFLKETFLRLLHGNGEEVSNSSAYKGQG
jgi:hypothetical protein